MTATANSNHDLKIRKRVQLVHIAANELGLLDPKKHDTDPDDEYHTILKRWNRPGTRQPVTSSLQMSYIQLGELLDFMTALGLKLKRRGDPAWSPASGQPHGAAPTEATPSSAVKKYTSSLDGLRDEICDLAKERWGEAWEQSLNKLCRKFGVSHWRFLNVNHGKAVKQRIESWQGEAEAE